jgi:2-dehydropantoate 2-reductase
MLVVGTGAVASFLLPRLRLSGQPLQVFGSPSVRLQALRAVASPALGAVSDVLAVTQHDDWLVVCKTWQNAAKVELLRAAPPPRRILVLQNGLEPEVDWASLGASVERGVSTYGVASIGPGLFVGGEVGDIAVPDGSTWAPILTQAGLRVRQRRDMRAAIWWKLVVNASLNVVAALGDLRNGEVLERPAVWRWAARAAEEVAGLAQDLGVELGAGEPVWALGRVARATAGNVCSTLADLRAGRPTEYDSINGALLKLAHGLGRRLPVLEELDREFALISSVFPAQQAAS